MAGSSSPFAIFRKHQKAMMVVITLLAIVSFIILPNLIDKGSAAAHANNEVVVTWKYGNIYAPEIFERQVWRHRINEFLQRAATMAQQNGGRPEVSHLFSTSELDVVHGIILNRRATELGVVVSDSVINNYIRRLTDNRVDARRLEQLINGLPSRGGKITPVQLYDALRFELTGEALTLMTQEGLFAVPPGQKWDYYTRLHRRANAQAIAVPVSDFIAKIPEPSDAVLQTFFDQHKENFSSAGSPEPGFRQPARVKLQYFKLDMATLINAETPGVTDDEIKQYYEQHKTSFRASKLPTMQGKIQLDPPAATAPTTPAAPAPTAKPAPAPKADEKKVPAPKADPKKQSRLAQPGDENLLALADDAKLLAQATKKEPAKAETTTVDAAKAPAKSEPAKPVPPAVTPATSPTSAATSEFDPLDKVKDQIRQSIARQKAMTQAEKILEELRTQVARYADDLSYWTATEGSKTGTPKPKEPDYAALANRAGVRHFNTGMLTDSEIANSTDVGKSFQFVEDPRSPIGFRQVPLTQTVFSQSLPLYRMVDTRDPEANRYLIWKVDQSKDYVPDLALVRPEVIKAWKAIQARDLAKKKAEEYAASANSAKKPLNQLFKPPQTQVKELGTFTWMTVGTVSAAEYAQPRLSTVAGLEEPSNDLMRAVFNLAPNQAVAAFNAPETICYAIQVLGFEPPDAELRQGFMRDMTRSAAVQSNQRSPDAYMVLARDEASEAAYQWIQGLMEEMGVEFKRPLSNKELGGGGE